MTVTIDGTNGITSPDFEVDGVTGRVYPIVSGTAVASTSGTSIDFTGIPSWVKRITVMFNGVSTSGTSGFLVQLGTSSGVVSSGYSSIGNRFDTTTGQGGISATSGFVIARSTAADVLNCLMPLCFFGSTFSWVGSHSGQLTTTNAVAGGGAVSLSETLDRVRITTVNGTDTFDAGSINILYE